MKLQILLIALLACTNLSSSRPAPQKYYRRVILKQLLEINNELNKKTTQNDAAVFTPILNISTPSNVNNPCECGAQFKKHLNESIHRVFDHLRYEFFDKMGIIFDTLEGFHPPDSKDGLNTSCNFQIHTIHNLKEINKIIIKDNINFIQKSNADCRNYKN